MRPSSLCAVVCVVLAVTLPTFARAASRDQTVAAPAKSGSSTGNASYYAKRFAGRKTASGERYDPNALTAAHRTLPLGTKVKVVNPENEQSVVVTVNDRGPLPKSRIIDVSSAAADALGMKKSGVTKVRTEVVGKTDRPRFDEPR